MRYTVIFNLCGIQYFEVYVRESALIAAIRDLISEGTPFKVEAESYA